MLSLRWNWEVIHRDPSVHCEATDIVCSGGDHMWQRKRGIFCKFLSSNPGPCLTKSLWLFAVLWSLTWLLSFDVQWLWVILKPLKMQKSMKLVPAISKHVVVIFNPIPPPEDIFLFEKSDFPPPLKELCAYDWPYCSSLIICCKNYPMFTASRAVEYVTHTYKH